MLDRSRRSRAARHSLLFLLASCLTASVVPAASAAPRPGTEIERQAKVTQVFHWMTLAPAAMGTKSQQWLRYSSGSNNSTQDASKLCVPLPAPDSLFAGYLHDTNGNLCAGMNGYEARNEFYRAALRFDLSPLAGHSLHQAILHLRVFKTHHRGIHSNPDFWDSSSSCAVTVAAGRSNWWQSLGDPLVMVDTQDPTVTAATGSADLQIDVTPIALAWLQGAQANYGLVLRGENEDLQAYTETICQTQYVMQGEGSPTLAVAYK